MKSMQFNVLATCLGLGLLVVGCQDHTSPPPPRVQSPPIGQDTPRPQQEPPKLLPNEVLPSYQPQPQPRPQPQPVPPGQDIQPPTR